MRNKETYYLFFSYIQERSISGYPGQRLLKTFMHQSQNEMLQISQSQRSFVGFLEDLGFIRQKLRFILEYGSRGDEKWINLCGGCLSSAILFFV